jgi:hypothetical protein
MPLPSELEPAKKDTEAWFQTLKAKDGYLTEGSRLQRDLPRASANNSALPLHAIRELPARSWVHKLLSQMVSQVRLPS